MKERLKNNKGFTLVEIIVVLVILAILAAIAVPAVLGYVDESKKTRYIEEAHRSEEHTSELQSHSFISYAVFCLKKKKKL